MDAEEEFDEKIKADPIKETDCKQKVQIWNTFCITRK